MRSFLKFFFLLVSIMIVPPALIGCSPQMSEEKAKTLLDKRKAEYPEVYNEYDEPDE